MWTGRQTLNSIDEALGSANNGIKRLDAVLSELSARQTENRRERLRACEGLASLRLDQISREELHSALSYADNAALSILQKRQVLINELNQNLNANQDHLDGLEKKRQQQSEEVNQQAQTLIECEHEAQSQLEDDDAYQQQLTLNQKADAIADRAEEKTSLAEADRLEKGKPFESDVLFMYLWKRQYAQPEYNANFLARFIDAWVARLCHYHKARVNYWMLLELPKRLNLHAVSVRDEADKELHVLQKMENVFAEKYGVLAAQKKLQDAQDKLDKIDNEIIAREEKQNDFLFERNSYHAGDDAQFKAAIHELATAMQRKDVVELQRLVNRTLDRQDDHLLASIIDLREEEHELEKNIAETRERQQAYLQKLTELKRVRTQFKRKRFDDVRSGFNNGGLIGIALNEFLKGVLNNGELWRVIERSQRHRDVGAWPDFGSGGLGGGRRRRKNNSPWHWPGGGGDGGFRLPRSGGSSSRGRGNGGFRTGGGF